MSLDFYSDSEVWPHLANSFSPHADVPDVSDSSSEMAEDEFQERMDIWWGYRYDPVLDYKKRHCRCNFCDAIYPRCTPVREKCLECLKVRMAEKLKPLHVKVPPQDVRERIMSFILPVEARKRDEKKFNLRLVLTQPSRSRLMSLEGNERSQLSGEKEEFVYQIMCKEDYWGMPCLLGYMLRFV